MAAPIPREPPVTKATLPDSLLMRFVFIFFFSNGFDSYGCFCFLLFAVDLSSICAMIYLPV